MEVETEYDVSLTEVEEVEAETEHDAFAEVEELLRAYRHEGCCMKPFVLCPFSSVPLN